MGEVGSGARRSCRDTIFMKQGLITLSGEGSYSCRLPPPPTVGEIAGQIAKSCYISAAFGDANRNVTHYKAQVIMIRFSL